MIEVISATPALGDELEDETNKNRAFITRPFFRKAKPSKCMSLYHAVSMEMTDVSYST